MELEELLLVSVPYPDLCPRQDHLTSWQGLWWFGEHVFGSLPSVKRSGVHQDPRGWHFSKLQDGGSDAEQPAPQMVSNTECGLQDRHQGE